MEEGRDDGGEGRGRREGRKRGGEGGRGYELTLPSTGQYVR